MPKFVASTTLQETKWKATLLESEVAEGVSKPKESQNLLIYGSAKLVQSLMQHGLIDVYRLVVLGQRLRLFVEKSTTTGFAQKVHNDVRTCGFPNNQHRCGHP